ncbi:hypothetical protein GCM10010415_67800 [Streptomyces atrovirens]
MRSLRLQRDSGERFTRRTVLSLSRSNGDTPLIRTALITGPPAHGTAGPRKLTPFTLVPRLTHRIALTSLKPSLALLGADCDPQPYAARSARADHHHGPDAVRLRKR